MQIGFAKRDISPPALPEGDLSIPILGFHWERAKAYREIHDLLYARAMVLRSGDSTALVFSCDLFGDAIGFGGRCAEKIQELHGVPADHVFFGCTHTHTSPDTLDICRKPVASWWVEQLVGQLVETAAEALGSLRPGALHWGETEAPGLAINRRAARLAAYEQTHGPVDDITRRRETAIDETLRVLCAIDPEGRPFGAVINFACHPVIVQTMPMISADFCGPAAANVENTLGNDFICVYLNGPSGDINPACGNSGDYRDCEKLGGGIAGGAVSVIQRLRESEAVNGNPIVGKLRSVTVERQELPDLDALQAEAQRLEVECRKADEAGLSSEDERHPIRRLNLIQEKLAVEEKPLTQEAPVHVLRVGDLRLVSLPGEICTALGQDVRNGIGGKVMLAQCSRAHLGYVCPSESFKVGGYETGPGTWSWLAAGAGEAMVKTAIETAAEV